MPVKVGTGFQGIVMAADGNMKAHERTYGSFISMVKWGSIIVAVATAAVVLLIAR